MSFRAKRKWIESYVEGELGFLSRSLLRWYLANSPKSFKDYEQREGIGDMLRGLPQPQAPELLRTRVLLAISRQKNRSPWPRWRVHLRNFMGPLAVPAAGGVLSAMILFAALIPNLWISPQQWTEDVPLTYMAKSLVTHPSMSIPSPISVTQSIDVEAFIDGTGRVYDFRMIHFPYRDPAVSAELRSQLANALLTTRFLPATSFGRPIPGRMFISFRPVIQVTVQG